MSTQYYEGIGRRKTATARVRIWPGGNGSVIINDKPGDEFLPREGDLEIALAPLRTVGQEAAYAATGGYDSYDGYQAEAPQPAYDPPPGRSVPGADEESAPF